MAAHPILVFLNNKKDKLVAAVPRTFQASLTWESIVQGVAIALEDPKSGAKLARCRPETVYASLLMILRLGLDPSPAMGQAYLIPRGTDCTAQIGAQGKIELAYRSGRIDKIVVQLVYPGDHCEIDLANGEVVHKITREQLLEEEDPGDPIACYARVWVKGSAEPMTELLRRRDFEKIRKAATKNGESPAYKDWWPEMWRRSTLNRALKRAPKSAELMEVLNREIDLLDAAESAPAALPDVDIIDADAPPASKALPDHGEPEDVEAELAKVAAKEKVAARKAPPANDADHPFDGDGDLP